MSEHDPFATRDSREDIERKRFIAQEQQRDDMQWFMSDPRGRRLMWSWLSFCGLFRSSMTGSSQTFFLEGQRNVGLMLQANILQNVPESWAQMHTEATMPKVEDT